MAIGQIHAYTVYIAPQFIDMVLDITEDTQWGDRGVRVMANGAQIEVYGSITRSLVKALEVALESHPAAKAVKFNSRGGRAAAAVAMENLIRAHGLDTLVTEECISLCTLAFLGGKHRCVAEGTRMGFHSPSFGGQMEGPGTTRVREQLAEAGVDRKFLDKVFATPTRSIWYPSPEELKSAGVITNVGFEACGGSP
jgi:hypothetical protein